MRPTFDLDEAARPSVSEDLVSVIAILKMYLS